MDVPSPSLVWCWWRNGNGRFRWLTDTLDCLGPYRILGAGQPGTCPYRRWFCWTGSRYRCPQSSARTLYGSHRACDRRRCPPLPPQVSSRIPGQCKACYQVPPGQGSLEQLVHHASLGIPGHSSHTAPETFVASYFSSPDPVGRRTCRYRSYVPLLSRCPGQPWP